MDMSLSKLQQMMKDREAGHAIVCGIAKSWTWLSNWKTETTKGLGAEEDEELLLWLYSFFRGDENVLELDKTDLYATLWIF